MSSATDAARFPEDAGIFVFGAGYSAGRFVEALPKASIRGLTVRSGEGVEAWRTRGLPAFRFDGEAVDGDEDALIGQALAETTHLLVSVPPGHPGPPGARVGGANATPGDPVLRRFGASLEQASPRLEWIGYLSTVGVYGDHDGAWIDETAELRPVSARSRERVSAEEGWTALGQARGLPVAILRLSGIYGPGRNAFRNLADGTARRIVKPGQVFNRIHVDDIAGAALLLARERLGGPFNVSDDEPAPPGDVVLHAARLAGVEPPPETPFDPAAMSPMARSFWGENKRVSNARLKGSGYAFRFPTYREGLAGLLPEA